MNLLSSVKRKIIEVLETEELGISKLSKKLDISVSEVWRQMKQLQEFRIVEWNKKGNKYKVFSLNQKNPLTQKILELDNLMSYWEEAVQIDKNQGIIQAIDELLKSYYISSVNVLISSSWDVPLQLDVIRVISIDEEREKIELLQNLSKIEIRCTYLEKQDFEKRKYYHEEYNKASLEQAIIDALATNLIDECDLAIQSIYLAEIDHTILSKLASSQYYGITVSLIKYVLLLATTFGLPQPVSLYDKKSLKNKVMIDDDFKNRTLQNFYRIFLGNGIAKKMNLY
ncbi:MAG: winged helix-turn-helix domain-containing protein [Candidatus Helarchaeota archaeon]